MSPKKIRETRQLNISMPDDLYKELKELVPEGERTSFIVDLTRKGLALQRLNKAADMSLGAWEQEDHPELEQGVYRYLRESRESGR